MLQARDSNRSAALQRIVFCLLWPRSWQGAAVVWCFCFALFFVNKRGFKFTFFFTVEIRATLIPLWTVKIRCELVNHCLLEAFPLFLQTLDGFQLQKEPSWYRSRRFNLPLCNNVESCTSVLLLLLILQHFFAVYQKSTPEPEFWEL